MELSLEQYERIQKWLDRRMTPDEEKAFQEELNSNPAMKEYLAFENEVREKLFLSEMEKGFPDIAIPEENTVESEEMKKRITAAGEKWKSKKQQENPLRVVANNNDEKVRQLFPSRRQIWYVAAACGIVAIISIALWLSSGSNHADPIAIGGDTTHKKPTIIIKDPKDTAVQKEVVPDRHDVNYASIVKKYYQKDEAPDPDDVPQYLRKSLKDYDDDNYSAITRTDLEDPPGARGNDEELQKIKELGHYYKGIAFIETKENSKAVTNLTWVVDSASNEMLKLKSRWYRGLIYLREEDIQKATKDLKFLSDKVSPYKQPSMDILKTLN